MRKSRFGYWLDAVAMRRIGRMKTLYEFSQLMLSWGVGDYQTLSDTVTGTVIIAARCPNRADAAVLLGTIDNLSRGWKR